MIFAKILSKEYWSQKTNKYVSYSLNFIINKNLLVFKKIDFSNFNNKEALYSFSKNFINIPKNFHRLDKNYLQFKSIEKHLGNKTLEFIIKHEFGHLNHHQFLSLEHNIHAENFEYAVLNSQSNYIKTNTSLDVLFDRTLSKPNPVEDFIHMNFMESYADIYAGLTSFLQDGDKSIFAKIYNFRLVQFKDLKTSENASMKQNARDNSIIEICSGEYSTSRYSNFLSCRCVKENIIQKLNFNKLNQMSIYDLHDLIQIEILLSLKETLRKEIKNNQLFNRDFGNYLKTKEISIADYFEKLENGILEYKNKVNLKIIHNELLLSHKEKLNQLIDFQANNHSFKSSGLLSNYLTIKEEQDLHTTIQRLKVVGKLDKNKKGLCKYIVNGFILPANDFSSLTQSLVTNKTVNQKHNKIMKVLSDEMKKYLINSYIGNQKIQINPLPELKFLSQEELIRLFQKGLTDKNKKEFNRIIAQYQIKEISTPYLSTSFDSHVLNNQTEGNFLQLKNDCLFSIKDIKTKLFSTQKNKTQKSV